MGRVFSEETRRKMSVSAKRRATPEAMAHVRAGITPASEEKRKATYRQAWDALTDDEKERRRDHCRQMIAYRPPFSPETKTKMSQAATERWKRLPATEEFRKRAASRSLAHWEGLPPEEKEAAVLRLKQWREQQTPETIRKNALAANALSVLKTRGVPCPEERKRRISATRKGVRVSEAAKLKIAATLQNRVFSEQHRKRLREGALRQWERRTPDERQRILQPSIQAARAALSTRLPTRIERLVDAALRAIDAVYSPQVRIGPFVVDFLVGHKTVIECDGTYWHSRPDVVARDKSKNAYLQKCGYALVRLPEETITSLGHVELCALLQAVCEG